MAKNLFDKTTKNVYRSSLENYEREGFVVHDPTLQFNDINEVYFKIDKAEVGEGEVLVSGAEYSFVPTEKKRIVFEGIEYLLVPTKKKRIPFLFIKEAERKEDTSIPPELIKGEYKENVPLSQIRSFLNYMESS